MAISKFSGSWKTRDDVMDNITPNNVVQPNVSVPAGEWKPAAWLPIVWTGEASKDSFVISSGKVVSFDRDGRIVPAGYAAKCADAAATTTTLITYTSSDVSAGVIDITTGSALSAAGTVSLAELATALLGRGLVAESEVDDGDWTAGNIFDPAEADDCKLVCAAFFSAPVGVCAYDVYVWAGDSAESLNNINYQKQHLIQFFTDMQMQVPHASLAQATTADLAGLTPWVIGSGDGEVFPDGADAGEELFINEAALGALDRYADLAPIQNVVAVALEQNPVAVNTERTPLESTGSALTRERTSYNKLSQAGDWHLDAEVGILFLYSADGTSAPASQTVDYFHYDSSESSAERQVCAVGELRAGDYVTYDAYSNFVKLDVTAATLPSAICGRVLAVVSQPKGLLDRVRTAWDGSSFSSSDKMPGTATAGYTDLITLSPENVSGTSGVADQVVLINVKMS